MISNNTKSYFEKINAVTSGVSELRVVIKKAEENYKHTQETGQFNYDYDN